MVLTIFTLLNKTFYIELPTGSKPQTVLLTEKIISMGYKCQSFPSLQIESKSLQ